MRLTIALVGLALCVSTPVIAQMGGYGGYGGGGGMSPMSQPSKPDDYAIALRDIRQEKFADAIPYLESALRQHPHNADLMNLLGSTNRLAGNYPLSEAWYKKALAENPDHKRAHENLGELYLALHDLPSAQAQLAELARLCPDTCDDRDALTKAIAMYQASASAAAPAAPQPTVAKP